MTEAERKARKCCRCKRDDLTPDHFPPGRRVCAVCLCNPVKQCSRCRSLKSIEEFSKDHGRADGVASYCLVCVATSRKKIYQAAPSKVWVSKLKRLYGITAEEYMQLIEAQDNRCWICGAIPKTRRLNIDHDHKIGNVKTAVVGLTCGACNKGMGLLRDNPSLLQRAAQFKLERPAQAILQKNNPHVTATEQKILDKYLDKP